MDIATAVWRAPVTVAATASASIGSSTTTALFTPDNGKRFCCHYLYIEAGGASDWVIQFRSGSAGIGTIQMNHETPLSPDERRIYDRIREFNANGFPLFLGMANGDAFNIVTTESGTATGELQVFGVMTQIDGTDF